MEKIKIVILLTAVIALGTAAIGFTFATAFNDNHFFGGMMGYTTFADEGDWWTEMREHMHGQWIGIEDEAWFDDMTQYMEEHWADVENQEWFDSMVEYMQEHGHYGYGHMGFGSRGFGC